MSEAYERCLSAATWVRDIRRREVEDCERAIAHIESHKEWFDRHGGLFSLFERIKVSFTVTGHIFLDEPQVAVFPSLRQWFNISDMSFNSPTQSPYVVVKANDFILFVSVHESDRAEFAEHFNWDGQCFRSPDQPAVEVTLCADEAKEAFLAGKL